STSRIKNASRCSAPGSPTIRKSGTRTSGKTEEQGSDPCFSGLPRVTELHERGAVAGEQLGAVVVEEGTQGAAGVDRTARIELERINLLGGEVARGRLHRVKVHRGIAVDAAGLDREAQVLAGIDLPGIARIHHCGRERGAAVALQALP